MGNAIGNFKEYWETYERYPALLGGFIWDWIDQGIQMPTPDGKGYYMAVGRVLSNALTADTADWKLIPFPDSLPIDHITMEAWFLYLFPGSHYVP